MARAFGVALSQPSIGLSAYLAGGTPFSVTSFRRTFAAMASVASVAATALLALIDRVRLLANAGAHVSGHTPSAARSSASSWCA
ncbi:MFS transporter [Pandoraea bronchicola]|uniref:MFS transporter n=2 Tax=Pandoraea bronchicola TaxID=2508287 RepID=A0A5E5BXV1_9BURK|nr:MFS transporter [Pandoraea bronchicola]